MKAIIRITFSTLIFSCFLFSVAQDKEDINKISKEQKLYELSVIWKEISYNFANMDNCPGLDIDSLYQAYIPIVQNTKNDWEYCKAIQRFLAHFNNKHVYCSPPSYIQNYLTAPLLITSYCDNKVFIDNIESQYIDINIGDEIITINNIPSIEYFQKYSIPYVSTSNEKDKIHWAMIGVDGMPFQALEREHKKLNLKVKTPKGEKKIIIAYKKHQQTSFQNNEKQYKKKYIRYNRFFNDHFFVEDSINNFAYICLARCDNSFNEFFYKHIEKIMRYKNLIVDVSGNSGGGSSATFPVIACLINSNSIYTYSEKTKINNALYKAWATVKILYYNDSDVPEFHKINYYPYYYGTALEDIYHNGNQAISNPVHDSLRYKGNVYIITGMSTISASEYFVAMLSQNKNITFLGERTTGALGQPLPVFLPSGIKVFINTTKTYDFNGNDISSGIAPNYEYDFSEFYQTEDPNEMLNKFIKTIRELETTR